MRRALAITLLVSGCASGATLGPGQDASDQGHDAPIGRDAPVGQDGHVPVDAAPHDAAPAIDAAADAPTQHDAAHAIDAAAPSDACVSQHTQLLLNPVFDNTPVGTGWTETLIDPAAPLIMSDGPPPQSAPFQVFLGGITGADEGTATVTDILTQDIAIPPNTTALELTGFYLVGTTETGSLVFDHADVALLKTDGTQIEDILALTNLSAIATYTPIDHIFANPATLGGTTVRLRLTSTNDDTFNSNFFFDTFALTATHGCP